MSIPLNGIEKKLQNLIEIYLVRYLPKQDIQQQLSEQIASALRNKLSNIGSQTPAQNEPAEFLLSVHPSMLKEWQNNRHVLDGIITVIQLATKEIGLNDTQPPSITILADPNMQVDELNICLKSLDNLSKTKTMAASEESAQMSIAFLIVGGTSIYNISQSVTNIGRRLDNQIILDDPRVSRYHAQVRYVKNRFILFDLNSTGGTYVNGERISQSFLYPGDVISLAGFPLVFGQDTPPTRITKGDTAPFSPASGERPTVSLEKNSKHPSQK